MNYKKMLSILMASAMVGTAPASVWAADFSDAVSVEADVAEETTDDLQVEGSADELQAEDATDSTEHQTEEFSSEADEEDAFDDGSAPAAQDWGDPSQSKDLVDMTNKNPVEVTNENISAILHQQPVYTKGKYYQLTEDIVLDNWSTAEYFCGTLDGNGHTITLQGNSSCFIHYLTMDGTLQNIGFLGAVTTSVGDLASSGDACVVATLQGKILNCYMDMTYGSTCKYTGGLVGHAENGNPVVSNCAIRVTRTNMDGNKFYPLAQEVFRPSVFTNNYWTNNSSDSSWGDGARVIQNCTYDFCNVSYDNAEMLNKLNTYKGANSVEWVAGEDGFPTLKKPEVKDKYTVSFTKADGTVIDNVQKNGISLKLQDVPASQNAGTLTVSGFDGKVAWLLSQYDSGKPSYEWAPEDQSNIWPGLYSGGLAVKGTGEATIVAWDESTLSHTVDKQDVPNENSVELARFKVTVPAGRVEAIRLVANGNETQDNNLTVQGSDWVSLQPQTKEEGSDKWEDVPVSSVEFPHNEKEYSTDDYQAVVTTKEAKYRAKKPGTYALTIKGFDKEYTVNVTSEYVPIESIKPAVDNTVTIYPSNYQGDGSQHNVGIALSAGTFNSNVTVTPANASYAYNWTMSSSDKAVADYTYDQGGTMGIVPKGAGEVTLTATSADPQQKDQVSGSTTVKFVYADEVAAKAFWDMMDKIPAADTITKDNAADVASTLKEARFTYDNLSQDNKIATGDEYVEKLTACEKKYAAVTKPAITLSNKTVSLVAGQSTTAVKIKTANNAGDKIKSVKSSNAKVAAATVKNGVLTVKGVAAGTATVTVTSEAGATATVKVTVAKPSITMTYKTFAMGEKQSTVAIKIKSSNVKGDKIKSVKSSNSKIAAATLKDGKLTVKGLKKGTATLTVTSVKGATATVKVTVVTPSMTLNYKNVTVGVKKSNTALKIQKSNVTWDKLTKAKSSDAKVAAVSVKDGKVTIKGLKKGKATVTVTSFKGATAKVTVTVK